MSNPAFSDLSSELDERQPLEERVDLCSPTVGAPSARRKSKVDKQLCENDGRYGDHFATARVEQSVPAGFVPLERDECRGVRYEAQGFSGGRSA